MGPTATPDRPPQGADRRLVLAGGAIPGDEAPPGAPPTPTCWPSPGATGGRRQGRGPAAGPRSALRRRRRLPVRPSGRRGRPGGGRRHGILTHSLVSLMGEMDATARRSCAGLTPGRPPGSGGAQLRRPQPAPAAALAGRGRGAPRLRGPGSPAMPATRSGATAGGRRLHPQRRAPAGTHRGPRSPSTAHSRPLPAPGLGRNVRAGSGRSRCCDGSGGRAPRGRSGPRSTSRGGQGAAGETGPEERLRVALDPAEAALTVPSPSLLLTIVPPGEPGPRSGSGRGRTAGSGVVGHRERPGGALAGCPGGSRRRSRPAGRTGGLRPGPDGGAHGARTTTRSSSAGWRCVCWTAAPSRHDRRALADSPLPEAPRDPPQLRPPGGFPFALAGAELPHRPPGGESL